jgi:GNAT superfamily N-acetyltransferase
VSVAVRRGFTSEEAGVVAGIIYEAFHEKYGPVFGDRATCLRVIAKYANPNWTLIAVEGGVILGVAGIAYNGEDFMYPPWRSLLGDLGFGFIRAALNGWVLYDHSPRNAVLLDELAVSPEARGKGVGTLLIAETVKVAREAGLPAVKLSVVDWNVDAKRLYTRLGFRDTKKHKVPWPWSRVFGFRYADEMTLTL